MNTKDVALVRESFAMLRPVAEPASLLFYGRLFELDPALRPMFKRDIAEQGRMLMHILNIAVTNLDRVELLIPALRDLGRRHRGYGVEDRHYDIVAEALLWTFAQMLGENFTPAMRTAWQRAYAALARTMQGEELVCAA